MVKLYNLCVAAGKYTSGGQKKTIWKNIGDFWKDDNNSKYYLTLDRTFNSAGVPTKEGSDSIFVSLFPPKDNQRASSVSQQPEPQGQKQDFDRNLTFYTGDGFTF